MFKRIGIFVSILLFSSFYFFNTYAAACKSPGVCGPEADCGAFLECMPDGLCKSTSKCKDVECGPVNQCGPNNGCYSSEECVGNPQVETYCDAGSCKCGPNLDECTEEGLCDVRANTCDKGEQCRRNSCGNLECILDYGACPIPDDCDPTTLCGPKNGCGLTFKCLKTGVNPAKCVKDEVACPPKGGSSGSTCTTAACQYVEGFSGTTEDFLIRIYNLVFPVGIVLGVLSIVIAGYAFVSSQGSPDKIKSASEKLTAAIIGILFIASSGFIIRIIIKTLIDSSAF